MSEFLLKKFVFLGVSFLPPERKKYQKEKMSQPTYPTWMVRPPVKQSFCFRGRNTILVIRM